VKRARARARQRARARYLCLLPLLAGCPHHHADKDKHDGGAVAHVADDAGAVHSDELPPAPPLPEVPAGLPPLPENPELAAVTPNALALGTLLFYDPRLSQSGKTSCATCHDPAHGYSGGIDNAADGKPNLRRTPALVNLAWATAFGWDGRYPSLAQLLDSHMRGQMGDGLEPATSRLLDGGGLPLAGSAAEGRRGVDDLPVYKQHFDRVGGAPQDAARAALVAFVATRYDGASPWDVMEPTARARTTDPGVAGYALFTGKAQCAVCHTPPLYTDHQFHRIGKVGVPDQGRGRVDPAMVGAFETPTLRGAAHRKSLFHTGDVTNLDDAVKWYELVGADSTHHDPAKLDAPLFKIALTPDEHAQLLTFLRALTSDAPAPAAPKLP
jgi:cytochrome c peroxidase